MEDQNYDAIVFLLEIYLIANTESEHVKLKPNYNTSKI